jgi:hypothetical protein
MAKAAPRVTKSGARPADDKQLALQLPGSGDAKAAGRLSDSHAELLRAALRDLGDARKILDPAVPR